LSFPDLAADVAASKKGKPGGTIYAALTAILRERMRRSGAEVTLLNCDNLRHNGERFRGGLLQFIDLLGDTPLRDWVTANTSSPNAMVDRITPRPTPDVAERVKRATGWADAVPVMSESFIQWVIEDDFCNGRRLGKGRCRDGRLVDAHEEAKIRLLTDAQLHRLGRHAGRHRYIHGYRDARIRRLAYD
jgi:D-arabinitol 4-dehydrogenase